MSVQVSKKNEDQVRFFNRELSWLEFNQRVLDRARDHELPLLDRLMFAAISASNLDEFFMVRVGGLQLLSRRGNTNRDPAGLTPAEQLSAIEARVQKMIDDLYECYLHEIELSFGPSGICRVLPEKLTAPQMAEAERFFSSEVSSVLSPIAVEEDAEFPVLFSGSTAMCVQLRTVKDDKNITRYAIIPLGRTLPRLITLPSDGNYEFILLEDVVGMYVQRFFPGDTILQCVPFRVTRNADWSLSEDLISDLMAEMEDLIQARRISHCVRLEVGSHATESIIEYLRERLDVEERFIHRASGPLNLADFMGLATTGGFENLHEAKWESQPSTHIDPHRTMFDNISDGDILLLHPFEMFDPVVRFIEEAATDPDVLAIKQTLYRVSRKSPIVSALIEAAENGKYVTAVVELKARFDEERNIDWARALEQSGVHVIYGVKAHKTHSKICMISRREPDGIQRYMHFSTGNYNEATARLYTDVSYFTRDPDLGADASNFFNAITGQSAPHRFHKLEAAPFGLRTAILEMIESEIRFKKEGQPAFIRAKMNSLVDPEIIEALYKASKAGVKVDLNIRGICMLRPGVTGLSENIRVISIVDRFLEHSRILHFHHGGDDLTYISSADWMQRNLDRRVELLVPVEDEKCRNQLIDILTICLSDTEAAKELQPDGTSKSVKPTAGDASFRSQFEFYRLACERVQELERQRRIVLEPYRPSD